MKKILQSLLLSAIMFYSISYSTNAQNGVKYPCNKKIPEIKIYDSGKIEQYYIKAQKRKKAGEEPTAKFIVTYHDFSDEAKIAFGKAVELWSYLIHSPVTIKIDATWQVLDQNVLGSAGPNSYIRDFANSPVGLKWYPIALANKLAGFDLEPEDFDIRARFSSSFNWYLGLDGNCPTNKHDFISTVMHEIGHGLGFTGSADVADNQGSWGSGTKIPFIFDRFVINGSDQLLIDTLTFENPSTELKTEYTSGNVFFQSELSDQANGSGYAKLYTPPTWDAGSSYSHLDEIYNGTENAMMTFASGSGEVIHHPGKVTMAMFAEMGWINLLYEHTILKDIETMAGPLKVETKIYSDSSLVDGSVYLHYSDDNFASDNQVLMSSTNDTLFTAEIPVLASGTTVGYYFEASTSLNRKYYYPVQGKWTTSSIDTVFSFNIGPDSEQPVISHTVTSSIFNFN